MKKKYGIIGAMLLAAAAAGCQGKQQEEAVIPMPIAEEKELSEKAKSYGITAVETNWKTWSEELREKSTLTEDFNEDGKPETITISYVVKEGTPYIDQFQVTTKGRESSFVLSDYNAYLEKIETCDLDGDGSEELLIQFNTWGGGGQGTHDIFALWLNSQEMKSTRINSTAAATEGSQWLIDEIYDIQKVMYQGQERLLARQYVSGEEGHSDQVGDWVSVLHYNPKEDSFASENDWLEKAEDGNPDRILAEDLEVLADKHGALTLEDFAPYLDLTALEEKGSLRETIEFSWLGTPMYLRVTASDKSLVSAPYEGALDGAVVFPEGFQEIETFEQACDYMGSCADIRSGNWQHILSGAVTMDDYLTVTLPEGLSQSSYCYWMGSRGGAAILNEKEAADLSLLEQAGMFADNPVSGGIEIWGAGEFGQGLETIKELEPLTLDGGVTLKRALLQTNAGTKWYAAYTEAEGSSISYCFYLRANQFTEEEFLQASGSIQLQEHAIY